MKTTVIYHRADFDGIFCREIACKFIPDAELIGWDFGDPPLKMPNCDVLYVMDLPLDRPLGLTLKEIFEFSKVVEGYPESIIWIDHHKSSIEYHPTDIPGYRIDGVAACRLAWQWFYGHSKQHPETQGSILILPEKHDFINRAVLEPLAVRLAGEYDVHDLRDPHAELLQFGLRGQELLPGHWGHLLGLDKTAKELVEHLLCLARPIKHARDNEYREVITEQGFDLEWEGVKFLACNSHELDIRSQLFEAGVKPYHEGLLGFTFSGNDWRVSLYAVPHKPDGDLSPIAKKYGGGGHRQACGFRCKTLPFQLPC